MICNTTNLACLINTCGLISKNLIGVNKKTASLKRLAVLIYILCTSGGVATSASSGLTRGNAVVQGLLGFYSVTSNVSISAPKLPAATTH